MQGGAVFIKKILIELTGTQRYGNEDAMIEISTFGTIRDDGAAYVLKYREEPEPPAQSVDVTVRIAKDESYVHMTRNGGATGTLLIEKEKRQTSNYSTGFGEMLMVVYGRSIKANADEGRFEFEYDIEINGAVASENRVLIEITPAE